MCSAVSIGVIQEITVTSSHRFNLPQHKEII